VITLRQPIIRIMTSSFLVFSLVGCGTLTPMERRRSDQKITQAATQALQGWEKISDLPPHDSTLRIHCANTRVCWLNDSKILWYSDDGGKTWNRYASPDGETGPFDYEFLSESVGFAYSSSALYKSIDGGRSWGPQVTPLNSPNGEIRQLSFINEKREWLAGGLFHPQTKEELKFGVPNNVKDISGTQILENAIFHSDDGGETWKKQTLMPPFVGRILTLSFADEVHGLATGEITYFTLNGGKSWNRPRFTRSCVDSTLLGDEYRARPTATSILKSGSAWLGFSDGRILQSSDYGVSWCDLVLPGTIGFAGPGPRYFQKLQFLDARNGYGLGSDRFLYQSRDGGKSWQRTSDDLTFDSVFFINAEFGIAVSSQGIFRKNSSATSTVP